MARLAGRVAGDLTGTGGQHATGAIRRARDRTRSGIMPTCVHPASRDQALAAVRALHAEHRRLPRWREWERATASRPCAKTIERRWGWRDLLAEAVGVRSAEIEVTWVPVLDDRAEAMLVALRAARAEFGRWPTATEWDRSGRRPSSKTFGRHFGGWRQACWAASGTEAVSPALSGRRGSAGPAAVLAADRGRPR